MANPPRVAFYLRVSTISQTVENQRRDLEAWAQARGYHVAAVYEDAGISGSKGRDKRPGLDAMLKDASRRKFDVVAAWSVDRLGRSMQHLSVLLADLHASGVDLYLHKSGLDTTTPGGKAMFQMNGVFAELERDLIRERVIAGMARAAKTGTKSGLRIGRPLKRSGSKALALEALREGATVREAVARSGSSLGTVAALRRTLAAAG